MVYKHKVAYYECDGMRITHHSNYVRFMEEARIDFLDKLGYGYEKMESDGVVSPVISVNCNFKRPTKFQDEIEIEISVREITTFKIKFDYVMKVGKDIVCTAESQHCFLENGKPVSLAEKYPDLFTQLSESGNLVGLV